ncbi:MAG: hypothetical protein ACXVRJ_01740 [Gaiellaceae bacterium]
MVTDPGSRRASLGAWARLLLAAAVLAAVLAAPASGGVSGSSLHRSAYAGLGTWLDIYATASWVHPQREVAAMAQDGVRTLYLQTGNYEQRADLVRPRALGRFVDTAHAAGMRVVAWDLPSFLYPARDTRRALAAIRFRSAKGERFDSFALDIEASLVRSEPLRSKRLLELSARLRAVVGHRYPLGAIIPSPVGIRRHPHYWPRFPYRPLARFYNVFLPMAYATDRHVRGVNATRAYDAADVAIIRTRTGRPHVPIHLIGGLANAMGVREVTGFMRAVADCAPLGYSLYAFSVTRQATWTALAAPPPGSHRSCT